MRCKHITVMTAERQYDYDVDAPSWEPKTLHELLTQHPSLTSIVVTFIPIEKVQ
jgi:hypothetical protein